MRLRVHAKGSEKGGGRVSSKQKELKNKNKFLHVNDPGTKKRSPVEDGIGGAEKIKENKGLDLLQHVAIF